MFFEGRILCFIVILLVTILASISQKNNKLGYLLFAVIILSLFAGFRDESVGIDTKSYYNTFNLISNNSRSYIYGVEETFVYISALLLRWFDSKHLLTLYSFIIYFFIFLRIWDFRNQVSISKYVFLFLISYFFVSINIFRQFISVALIFYATRYLEDKKRSDIKFFSYMIIALLFHRLAILGLIFYLVELLNMRHYEFKRKLIAYVFLLICIFLISQQYSNYINKYLHYLNFKSIDFGLLFIIRVFYFLYLIVVWTNNRKLINKKFIIYYFIGICFTFSGYIYLFLDRTGIYFMIFEPVIMLTLAKKGKYGQVSQMFLYLWICIYLFSSFYGNGQGQFPYIF